MPIDIGSLISAKPEIVRSSWSADDVILYHLGIGAGDPPTDPMELRYVYEASLEVLPTFSVLPPSDAVARVLDLPGFAVDRSQGLHGEQETIAYRPLPATATVTTAAKVSAVYDKGAAALAVIEATTSDEAGETLFVNRYSLFFRGEGGFGGDRGSPSSFKTPEPPPSRVRIAKTLPQQALLYRLSGDKTDFHADPEAAAAAGFPRPILQGLCTYGIAAKAVVDECAQGRPSRLSRFAGRFSGVVYPGESLTVSMWDDGGEVDVVVGNEKGNIALLAKARVSGDVAG